MDGVFRLSSLLLHHHHSCGMLVRGSFRDDIDIDMRRGAHIQFFNALVHFSFIELVKLKAPHRSSKAGPWSN